MRTTVIAALAAAVLATGCVGKKKYNDLQGRYDDLSGRYAELQTSASGMRMELSELEEHVAMLRQSNEYLGSFYSDLLNEFRSQLDGEEMEVIVYPDRLSLALAQDVTFNSGSAGLSSPGQETLESLAELLARHPERRFHVEGHTDDVPIDNARYDSNWELGAARAVAVVEQLVAAGVPAERLAATSYGETQPLVDNGDPESRRLNRRVEIAFQPTLEELPGHRTLVDAAKRVTYARGADQSAVPEIAGDRPRTETETRPMPVDAAPEVEDMDMGSEGAVGEGATEGTNR